MEIIHIALMDQVKISLIVEMYDESLLIAIESCKEKKSGISHLFEHIFISYLRCSSIIAAGITTEDYIYFIHSKARSSTINRLLKHIEKKDYLLDKHKKIIIEEIRENENSKRELFYSNIWKNTIYEKSPFGKVSEIEEICTDDLDNYIDELNSCPMYFYRDERIRCRKPALGYSISNTKNISLNKKHNFLFDKKRYHVIYYKNDTGIMNHIKAMLLLINPNSTILISEKRYVCALVYEKRIRFPVRNDYLKLREGSIKYLINSYNMDEARSYEFMLKKLETMYYYNCSWDERKKYILNIPIKEVIETIENVKHMD